MHVTLLLAEHCSAASAAMALDILQAANLFHAASTPLFVVQTASLNGEDVHTSSGQILRADKALPRIRQTDLILIPGFLFTLPRALPTFGAYAPWLRQQHAKGATVATMCNAAFMLAESGLLDGRPATTHWAFGELFQRRYPAVSLDTQHIVCDTGSLITSGGATAAMDLLLHLISRWGSPTLAQTCSKYLLIDPARSAQTPYASWRPMHTHGDDQVLKVQHWLDKHFAKVVRLDDLAEQFGFGPRNFKRRFKEATGQAPLAYLQGLRLNQAKRLLESTRMSMEAVTSAVGYEDSNSFRRLFQERVGMAPTAYRRRFQQLPKMETESST